MSKKKTLGRVYYAVPLSITAEEIRRKIFETLNLSKCFRSWMLMYKEVSSTTSFFCQV